MQILALPLFQIARILGIPLALDETTIGLSVTLKECL
jgi:hypothetical protein